MNTSRVTIRFNEEELSKFKKLKKKLCPNANVSGYIKSIVIRDQKPFLVEEERKLLKNYIYEINAIGRNLNQLLKYKKYSDCTQLIQEIQEINDEVQKILPLSRRRKKSFRINN